MVKIFFRNSKIMLKGRGNCATINAVEKIKYGIMLTHGAILSYLKNSLGFSDENISEKRRYFYV